MKILGCFISLILLSSCIGYNQKDGPKKSNKTNAASEASSPSTQALALSAAVSNSIIAEKDLLLKSSNASAENKYAVTTISSETLAQTAAKGEELLSQSKSIIDCTLTLAVDSCIQ
ncbi:MAG: hypothetical protein Q7U04_16185 [Bacteriovorax sp.]|nr:hypothetical protein [Bacteriovorax sp.]